MILRTQYFGFAQI